MARGIQAQGITLKVSIPGSPTAFSAVGNLVSGNLSGSAGEVDFTSLDSTAFEGETSLAKFQFGGTLNLDPDNARHQEIRNALLSRTRCEFQLTLTDATPSTCTFGGFVTSWAASFEVNGKVSVEFSVLIDGGWAWA